MGDAGNADVCGKGGGEFKLWGAAILLWGKGYMEKVVAPITC
jgi:hypothetical protein